jgi:integrase
MPTIKLTQPAVERLKPPVAGRVEYWDNQLPGFGLRLSPTGRKTWLVMYRVGGKKVRETIGTIAVIKNVADAREKARASMREAQAGIHPVKARRARQTATNQQTFAAVADLFLERYAKRNTRERTFIETTRIIERDVKPKWGERFIHDIARRDMIALLDGIVDRGAPTQANRTLAALRRLFNWAIERDYIETSPASRVSMPGPEHARDRILSDTEIRLFWHACGDISWPFGPMFRLLLLTAQRREETATMEWSELDLAKKLWTIPREKAKNDRTHEVHLSELALAIISDLPRIVVPTDDADKPRAAHEFVFTTNGLNAVSGFSKAKERVDAKMLERYRKELTEAGGDAVRAVIPPFTLHDLRRTAASGMASIGIAPHVVDRILNHVSGTIRGVAAVYNRHAYASERAAALDVWSRHIAEIARSSGW